MEEFGTNCFQKLENGKLLFQADYTNKENLITWILSFRDKAELLEPEEIRAEIRQNIEDMRRNYMKKQQEILNKGDSPKR